MNFELIFVQSLKFVFIVMVFACVDAKWFRTICWKLSLLHPIVFCLRNQLVVFLWIYFMAVMLYLSILLPVLYCIDCGCFLLQLRFGLYQSSKFIPFLNIESGSVFSPIHTLESVCWCSLTNFSGILVCFALSLYFDNWGLEDAELLYSWHNLPPIIWFSGIFHWCFWINIYVLHRGILI